MKTIWRRLTAVLGLCMLLLAFTGCDSMDDPTVRGYTDKALSAIVSGDADAAYACVTPTVSREEFDAVFAQMHTLIGNTETYTLKPTALQVNTRNGVTLTTVTYTMVVNGERAYTVEAATDSRYEGLHTLHLTPAQGLGQAASVIGDHPMQIVLLAVAVLETVFAVWMLIDCARRPIKNKTLWLILILFGMLVITSTTVNGVSTVGTGFGFLLSFTSLGLYGSVYTRVRVLIPIGAIVYAFVRRRLALVEPPCDEAMPTLTPMPPDLDGRGE